MTTDTQDRIHVALAVYDPKGTYSRYAGVVMTSIFERTKSSVCVHILHDQTLTERNRSLLRETTEIYGQRIELHDVSSYVRGIGDEAVHLARKGCTVGTLYRLLIPNILPLDKVIYLDCDIVVNLDIRELWDVSLDGVSFAGALDCPHKRFSPKAFRLNRMGADRKTYVNAGVLLMNLPRIRQKFDLIHQSLLWCKRYGHLSDGVDQDLINSCFRGDIKIIDSRFNCGANDGNLSGLILHAMESKPWSEPEGSELDRLFWKTYLKTPWGRLSSDETVDLMLDVVRSSPIMHRRTSQCYRKIVSRLRKDVVCNNVMMVLWLWIKDLYYRFFGIIAGEGR